MFLKTYRFPVSRLRRLIFCGLGAGGILTLLVFLGPTLVASRFVWPRLVAYLTADVVGRVSTGEVSLGWFSPVVIRDVVVQDSHGVDLATISTVRTRKSLWALVVRRGDLGVIRVEQPRGSVALRDGGSDWEDVFREVLSRESGGSHAGGTIEVVDGQVDVLDEEKVLHGRLESIHAIVELPNTDAQPGTIQLIRCLVQTPGHAGSCVADATWRTEGDTWQCRFPPNWTPWV
jgi:translocation and assembly module TamB